MDYLERYKTQEDVTVDALGTEKEPLTSSGAWDVTENYFTVMDKKKKNGLME